MRPTLLALLPILVAATARADEAQPWSLAFVGGALFPRGDMAEKSQPSLDVGARVGLRARSGLGLQLGVELSPLRAKLGDQTEGLYAASLGPHFTLGHDVVRLWAGAAGGLIVTHTDTWSSAFTVNGLGGLDLHVFDNGGFTFSGQYVRSVSSGAYEYLAVTGGLVFTM